MTKPVGGQLVGQITPSPTFHKASYPASRGLPRKMVYGKSRTVGRIGAHKQIGETLHDVRPARRRSGSPVFYILCSCAFPAAMIQNVSGIPPTETGAV
jgi:hypothetical protein